MTMNYSLRSSLYADLQSRGGLNFLAAAQRFLLRTSLPPHSDEQLQAYYNEELNAAYATASQYPETFTPVVNPPVTTPPISPPMPTPPQFTLPTSTPPTTTSSGTGGDSGALLAVGALAMGALAFGTHHLRNRKRKKR